MAGNINYSYSVLLALTLEMWQIERWKVKRKYILSDGLSLGVTGINYSIRWDKLITFFRNCIVYAGHHTMILDFMLAVMDAKDGSIPSVLALLKSKLFL